MNKSKQNKTSHNKSKNPETDKRFNKSIVNGIVTTPCKYCGKTNYPYIKTPMSSFCSWACYEKHLKIHTTPNVRCEVCGKEFYLKPSRIKKIKKRYNLFYRV